MDSIRYSWHDARGSHLCEFVLVRGTNGMPYHFGEQPHAHAIEVSDFYVSVVPVTQDFWTHVMGAESNPALHRGPHLPVENVSWNALTESGGLLDRLNDVGVGAAIRARLPAPSRFRLPTESEWEYAARGGMHWRDQFLFSGSNDIDAVAWYDRRHGDHTQPVALKAPNQLGLFDLSGNVWEWCQDAFTADVSQVPSDGSAFVDATDERVLRGGCFHNWAIHCTVSKRYAIGREFHDGCIGVRLVLSDSQT